jgi:hypothetical protein
MSFGTLADIDYNFTTSLFSILVSGIFTKVS